MFNQQLVQIEFHEDTLWATEQGGEVFVVIKSISDRLGIDWRGQQQRIQRDAVLCEGTRMIRVPSPGGAQETTLLRLDLVNGWLFGIDENRVKDEETRERVIVYKRECYRVLFERFFQPVVGAEDEPSPALRLLLPGHPDFGQAVRLVREARLSRGTAAALAIWKSVGLPWVPEMEANAEALGVDEDDAVGRFAIEGIEKVRGVVTPAAMLWPAFTAFCAQHRLHTPGQQSFLTRFGRMGFKKSKSGGRSVYHGIRPILRAMREAGGE